MSYLDLPRFHLFGTFFATPSTINNVTQNYDPDTRLINKPGLMPGVVGWNPTGQALFKVDVAVKSAAGADGTPVTSGDTLLGATLTSILEGRTNGKIVDLDPDQQNITQVFGLTVRLAADDGTVLFTGSVATCALAELWIRTAGQAGSITTAGGMYQTVIEVSSWGDISGSPVLLALRDRAGNSLSIKWNLDGFNGKQASPGFSSGRMTATIGPAYPGEPRHFLAARRLDIPSGAVANTPQLWFAPFKVDKARSRLVLDLGNSVPTSTPGGPFTVATLPVSVNVYREAATVGEVDYTLDHYQTYAGVFELPLTLQQVKAVQRLPLGITVVGTDGTTYRIVEPKNGVRVGADLSFLRLNPGESEPVTFYATRFGAPHAGFAVNLRFSVQEGPPGPLGNDPKKGLSWSPAKPVTGSDGSVVVNFTGGSTAPKAKWRMENDIDGQVYFVSGNWSPAALDRGGMVPVTALVFDDYQPKSNPPTWWGDIQPIMYQYARLYPGMRQILDISDYGTLTANGLANAHRVMQAMLLPIDDPNHMPVTRDLSQAKLNAYVAWVNAGCPEGTPPAPAAPAGGVGAGAPAPAAEEVVTAVSETVHGPGADSIKSRL